MEKTDTMKMIELTTFINAINGMEKLNNLIESFPDTLKSITMALSCFQYDPANAAYEKLKSDIKMARVYLNQINGCHKLICEFDMSDCDAKLGLENSEDLRKAITVQFAVKAQAAIDEYATALDKAKEAIDNVKQLHDIIKGD